MPCAPMKPRCHLCLAGTHHFRDIFIGQFLFFAENKSLTPGIGEVFDTRPHEGGHFLVDHAFGGVLYLAQRVA